LASLDLLLVHAHAPQLLVAVADELVGRQLRELPKVPEYAIFQVGGHSSRLPVGAAERLGHDLVDDAEAEQVIRP
jgi:hypothetical protein